MSRVHVIRGDEGTRGLSFKCPGCGDSHVVAVDERPGPTWRWNGDVERPTLSPSLLVRTGHHAFNDVDHAAKRPCWCTWRAEGEDVSAFECYVCHSFITDGRIQFLADCTHALAGQTVDLPEVTP